MSFDLAVWSPVRELTRDEADQIYGALCEEEPIELLELLNASPAIETFYLELISLHPSLDDVPDDRIDDHDYCPWSCSFDRSDRHMTMSCVWSQAENVARLVSELAAKHGLSIYDPQDDPNDQPNAEAPKKPWWRFW